MQTNTLKNGDATCVPNFQLCMLTSQGFLCAPSTNHLHGYCTAPLDTAYTTSVVSHTAWVGGVGKTHKGANHLQNTP